MKFEPPIFHPNSQLLLHELRAAPYANALPVVYADGTVCISILHTPGDDPTMYEQASERWSPVQSVEKVILSVISMLAGTSWPLFLGRADCAGTAYPRGGYHPSPHQRPTHPTANA